MGPAQHSTNIHGWDTRVVLLIFGVLCNLVGLVLVLGDGIVRVRDKEPGNDHEGGEGERLEGSWPIAAGGFLIILGSAVATYEVINRWL